MWGGGPQGFHGCSVTIMVKWTNSGFVGSGGGGPGVWGGGPRGVPWTFRHYNGQMDK